jgi:uncharacterized metal-binding protein (TIGR02443 family)
MANRRFIAGAVCPQCQAIDRLIVEDVDGERRQRCVACGFSERAAQAGPGLVKGRLEKPRVAAEPEPLRIVDPQSVDPKDE